MTAIALIEHVDMSTNKENMRVARADNKTGFLGVFLSKRHKARPYVASIRVKGRLHTLGYYATPEAAHAAYLEAKRRLHAGCTI